MAPTMPAISKGYSQNSFSSYEMAVISKLLVYCITDFSFFSRGIAVKRWLVVTQKLLRRLWWL
ncbi:Uncharacterized protein APZ42_027524 [Daphnia magna]|uniref:Uncharacterized protein n=1 Tax=Daphnia magna TaxID=35525 RepID=A0A164RNC7_9CRUS|nr:Uncharacterized protein APZ42_027524 [Daphnia magna]